MVAAAVAAVQVLELLWAWACPSLLAACAHRSVLLSVGKLERSSGFLVTNRERIQAMNQPLAAAALMPSEMGSAWEGLKSQQSQSSRRSLLLMQLLLAFRVGLEDVSGERMFAGWMPLKPWTCQSWMSTSKHRKSF